MNTQDYGITIGSGKPGERDLITDVPGVRVGQTTVAKKDAAGKPLYNTGVTVILPCEGFVYDRKPTAAAYVQNGYGKTAGTVQLNELGTLESPIALTNTLNVGLVSDALVEYMLKESQNPAYDLLDKKGRRKKREIRSINVVVGETNDSGLNTIADRAVTREDVLQAIESAGKDFEQGAVGAGRGTICCDLKGGIGSASRVLTFGGHQYTLGVLVQSNFGSLEDLMINGAPAGRMIMALPKDRQGKPVPQSTEDVGSIMIVTATDLPLTYRQLVRVLKRCAVGLARTGSYMGHGSGDVFLGFTTGNCMGVMPPYAEEEERLPFYFGGTSDKDFVELRAFPEEKINEVFRLEAECTEEAILNSLFNAQAMQRPDGKWVRCLMDYWPLIENEIRKRLTI